MVTLGFEFDLYKACDSDHATEILDIDLNILNEKPVRRELYNFKDKVAQEDFKSATSETKDFTVCFLNDVPLIDQVEDWRKVLNLYCRKSFKKIRIKTKSTQPLKPKLSRLIDLRNSLSLKDKSSNEIDDLNKVISEIEAEENRRIIMDNFKSYSEDPETVNITQMWKTVKKLWPKNAATLPTAKKNHKGHVITGHRELKVLFAKEYKERLRNRPIKEDFLESDKRQKIIFDMKLKLAQSKKSPDWTYEDLTKALDDLKRNKSRDHEGLANELFKNDVIGSDLKQSLLIMYNRLRKEQLIPTFLNFTNISTVHKKGSKLELVNDRGIFRVSVPRYILMRLIYNSKYPEIDRNISDCQMGARKGKSCKNNIFIVNGIIHNVLKSKSMKPVLLQIYDYSQMFDSINLQKAINDVYDAGLNDDNLGLIFKANNDVQMAVNTPGGLSERQQIKNNVLQGDTFGSILASVQVDTIGQECEESGYGYMYKDSLPISLLGLVDDMVGVSEAGFKAQQLNALINVKTAEKGLQFGVTKCKSMLIAKDKEHVLNSDLTVDKWKAVHNDESEPGEDTLVDIYEGQVPIEKSDEQKYLGFVLSSKGNNMVNISHVKKKSKGTIRRIFDKLNSLNLGQYYFESGLVMMNAMLRSSILYACETYYNLKEGEIRQLERIEEQFLRELLKTSKGCPVIQLYLELGQIPARFEIIKIRLLYLKYILDQNPSSMIFKFFELQLESTGRGDWTTMCLENLAYLNINLSLEEIKNLSCNKFKSIVKQSIQNAALAYLIGKQGSKGGEIQYTEIYMADYLLPINSEMSREEKQEVFSMRNKMTRIPANYSSSTVKHECVCGDQETMEHVYTCTQLNSDKPETEYKTVYSNNIEIIKKVHRRFEENMKNREIILKERENGSPCDPSCDPLYSV